MNREAPTSDFDLPLYREEYVEQAYFFRVFRERLEDNLPSQEILETIREEILSTTKLYHAVDFLRGEMQLKGLLGDGMARIPHYFTPYQAFVMQRSEEEGVKFEQRTALVILERMADYLAKEPSRQGLFVFQFECVARNRLGYDAGMSRMADDPAYDAEWQDWIRKSRHRLGTLDFAEMIYYRSAFYVEEVRRRTGNADQEAEFRLLFGSPEGRIAKANRGRDPLYTFAALQRHLGFPAVPRPKPKETQPVLHPAVEARLQRIEQRIQLVEAETKDEGINLEALYKKQKGSP